MAGPAAEAADSDRRRRRPGPAVTIAAVLLCVAAACTPDTSGTGKHTPAPSITTASAFPSISGGQFDQSLRNGNTSLPKFGRLLAATQTGGPKTITVDLNGIEGSVVGVFACKGEGAPRVQLRRLKTSLLTYWADGCDPDQLYSGESEQISAGPPTAELKITVPESTEYAFVLEEVLEEGAR